jgi:UPF0755 protein
LQSIIGANILLFLYSLWPGRKTIILTIVVVTVLLSSFTFYFYQVIYAPNFLVEKASRHLYLPTGATFEDVQKIIYKQKFVNDPVAFGMLAKFMDYDEMVKPGRYLIDQNASNLDVIRKLRIGDQDPVRITFSQARYFADMASKLTANIELDSSDLLTLLEKPETAAQYGFDRQSFPCMFIPNTYEVYWTISADELLVRMKSEYDQFWTDERLQKARSIGLTPIQVAILASIVQAEISHYDEASAVAGLYLNRLERNMFLQADPTLVFAIGDFSIRRVLNIHKQVESPYNTYKYIGLPPGPINFPSIKSLDAVLDAEDHNYLYMCAKADFSGYHDFSTNLRDHQNKARNYQKALNKARLYR